MEKALLTARDDYGQAERLLKHFQRAALEQRARQAQLSRYKLTDK